MANRKSKPLTANSAANFSNRSTAARPRLPVRLSETSIVPFIIYFLLLTPVLVVRLVDRLRATPQSTLKVHLHERRSCDRQAFAAVETDLSGKSANCVAAQVDAHCLQRRERHQQRRFHRPWFTPGIIFCRRPARCEIFDDLTRCADVSRGVASSIKASRARTISPRFVSIDASVNLAALLGLGCLASCSISPSSLIEGIVPRRRFFSRTKTV